MTKFVVNGQEVEVRYEWMNGIDISGDFIGNTSHGMQQDEEGRYIATPEDLKWWQETIAAHEQKDAVTQEYIDKYGYEAVEKAIKYAVDTDLDIAPTRIMEALKELD